MKNWMGYDITKKSCLKYFLFKVTFLLITLKF